jgi:hypothetical protein
LRDPLHEPAPALPHADDLPTTLERPAGGRPDDSVQARAIAAADEDPDALRHRI